MTAAARYAAPTMVLPRDPRTTEALRTLVTVERYETLEAVIAMRATLECAPTTLEGHTDEDIADMLASI